MRNPLELHKVTKSFGDVVALDAVDLELRPREILGLIGQNGSGKSTLLRIMTGIHRPTSGEMLLRGEKLVLQSPLEAIRRSIGMVHQEQSLLPNLTVAENLYLNHANNGAGRFGIYDWKALYKRAQSHLDQLELSIGAQTLVGNLSFGQRQMVELAKVLAIGEATSEELIILFDEATAIMSGADIEILFKHIRRVTDRASVVFVSHRMDEVLEISDRIYCLSDGKIVAERTKSETRANELYELMVGSQRVSAANKTQRKRPSAAAGEKLRLTNASSGIALKPTSLVVKQGEILGLIGVHGSGAEELCRVIFGAEDTSTGDIFVDGRRVRLRGPREAVHNGIGYVPAERKLEGCVLERSVAENMCLAQGNRHPLSDILIDKKAERSVVDHWFKRLGIKARSPQVSMLTLSGGNQQKAVLGKWLATKGISLLLLDHPTRGLDPGARADVFDVMRQLSEEGLTVIFVADTLDEVLLVSDRVLVLRDGEVSAEFEDVQTDRPPEAALVKAMV